MQLTNCQIQGPMTHIKVFPDQRWNANMDKRTVIFPCLEKLGNLVTLFPGNFTIWREIVVFGIKKYIRNIWKVTFLEGDFAIMEGNVDSVPGKGCIFSSRGYSFQNINLFSKFLICHESLWPFKSTQFQTH